MGGAALDTARTREVRRSRLSEQVRARILSRNAVYVGTRPDGAAVAALYLQKSGRERISPVARPRPVTPRFTVPGLGLAALRARRGRGFPVLRRALLVFTLLASLAGCGGVPALEATDAAPPPPGPTATATVGPVPAVAGGLWKRPLACTDRIRTGIHATLGAIVPAPDRTPEDVLRSTVDWAASNARKPWDQLADLEWEKRAYHQRPKLRQNHVVFVGSRDGVERAAVYVERRWPGPTWVNDDKELCVEPVPPRVHPDRTYAAPLTCPARSRAARPTLRPMSTESPRTSTSATGSTSSSAGPASPRIPAGRRA